MNARRQRPVRTTPVITWWLVFASSLVVIGGGVLGPALGGDGSAGRAAGLLGALFAPADTRDVAVQRRVALVEAVTASADDPAWADVDLRDALCDALIRNTRAAVEAGALGHGDRAWYAWLPPDDVRAGFAHHALGAERPGRRELGVVALLKDPRWEIRAQRGPLCHALVSAERELPPLW